MGKRKVRVRDAVAVNCDPGVGLNTRLHLHLPLVGHGPAVGERSEPRLGRHRLGEQHAEPAAIGKAVAALGRDKDESVMSDNSSCRRHPLH